MTINTTQKEMPTGDGNPTAGNTINDLDFAIPDRADKAFCSLRAAFAMQGHALHRSNPGDGPVSYWAERWGLVKHLNSLEDACRFLAQIGGAQ